MTSMLDSTTPIHFSSVDRAAQRARSAAVSLAGASRTRNRPTGSSVMPLEVARTDHTSHNTRPRARWDALKRRVEAHEPIVEASALCPETLVVGCSGTMETSERLLAMT